MQVGEKREVTIPKGCLLSVLTVTTYRTMVFILFPILFFSHAASPAIAATNYTSRESYLKSSSLAVLPGETNGPIRSDNSRSIDDESSFSLVTIRANEARKGKKGIEIFINFFFPPSLVRESLTIDGINENRNRGGRGIEEPFVVSFVLNAIVSYSFIKTGDLLAIVTEGYSSVL